MWGREDYKDLGFFPFLNSKTLLGYKNGLRTSVQDSVLAWVKTAIEVRGQEKEMARLQSEIEDMDSRIDNLTSNRDSIETYARETYHFAAPGDDVYIDD